MLRPSLPAHTTPALSSSYFQADPCHTPDESHSIAQHTRWPATSSRALSISFCFVNQQPGKNRHRESYEEITQSRIRRDTQTTPYSRNVPADFNNNDDRLWRPPIY